MTKQEFENRLNQKTTAEQFEEINEIYMALPDMDKNTFCNLFKNNKVTLLKELAREIVKHNNCKGFLEDRVSELTSIVEHDAQLMLLKAADYSDADLYDVASDRLGTKKVLKFKLEHHIELNIEELSYLSGLIDNN